MPLSTEQYEEQVVRAEMRITRLELLLARLDHLPRSPRRGELITATLKHLEFFQDYLRYIEGQRVRVLQQVNDGQLTPLPDASRYLIG